MQNVIYDHSVIHALKYGYNYSLWNYHRQFQRKLGVPLSTNYVRCSKFPWHITLSTQINGAQFKWQN